MSKRYMFVTLIAIAIFIIPFVVMAQDGGDVGDPFYNDPDNLCDEGQSWAGQCSSPEMSPEQQAWAWKCGWYFARIATGQFDRGDVSDQILNNCFETITLVRPEVPVVIIVEDDCPEEDDGINEGGEDGQMQGLQVEVDDCDEGGDDFADDGGGDDEVEIPR